MIVQSDTGEHHIIVQLGDTEEQIMVEMAVIALDNNAWNITRASKSMGITRTCLAMRLRRTSFGEAVVTTAMQHGLSVKKP